MDPGQHTPRPRIPNPNHSNPAPASASPSFAPSTQQPPPPPLHQPPYSRDSFRPSSQHDRRDPLGPSAPLWQSSAPPPPSYLPHDQQRDTLQPGPAPPPSPYSRPPTFRPESSHSRRGSLVNDTPQNGPEPSGSPPSFANGRHMPPPSHVAASPTRKLHHVPAPQSYAPHREPTHAMNTSPRPTSRPNNMSISSVLDSDSPSKHNPPAWSPTASRNGQYAPHNPPASPSHQPTSHNGSDEGRSRGHSPPRYGPVSMPRQNGGPGQSMVHGPPDRSRTGFANILHSPHSASPPPHPRPISQSAMAEGPPRDPRDSHAATSYGPPLDHLSYSGKSTAVEEVGFARPNDLYPRDRHPYDPLPQYGPLPQNHYPTNGVDHPQSAALPRPSHWQGTDSTELKDEDRPILSREGPQLPEDIMYGPHLPTWYSHGREPYGPHHDPAMIPPPGDKQSPFARRPPFLDPSLRRSLEDSQMAHRSILGAHEAHRRIDRGSPLPQAVQGVSSQPVGSGRDPNIKMEFTRVFSGLGSGVGSTPVPMPPNGSPTPVRRSNDPEGEYVDDRDVGPRSVMRKKRPVELDGKADSDGESRKRRAAHHHHHHQGHRPHHHHPKADELSGAVAGRRSSATPLGTSRDQPNGTPGRVHHHHAPHHHHQPGPAAPAPRPPQPIRRPVVTIKTQPLLESVAHLPRKHLGSQLYAPLVTMPSSRTTSLYSKFRFGSKPNPIPKFEDKENCTFTIRVQREHLADRSREHICQQRQVWGTDVYTDDSDPIAASIHSGWIRGAWAHDVDVDMLELDLGSSPDAVEQSAETTTDNKSQATLTGPPSGGPVAPPADRDAYITILVLPPLEQYTSSTWYGVRSRHWGNNHDGMSFKIHKIEWVDAGAVSRFEEPKAKSTREHRLSGRRQDASRTRPAPRISAKSKAAGPAPAPAPVPV